MEPIKPMKSGRIFRVVERIASLKLTVVLLALFFLLVLFGTLYQVDNGILRAQQKFFYSWFITQYLIPLPGGQLVLWLIGVNLLASLVIHTRSGRYTVGLFLSHLGLIFL